MFIHIVYQQKVLGHNQIKLGPIIPPYQPLVILSSIYNFFGIYKYTLFISIERIEIVVEMGAHQRASTLWEGSAAFKLP